MNSYRELISLEGYSTVSFGAFFGTAAQLTTVGLRFLWIPFRLSVEGQIGRWFPDPL
jgi:hypothetical protein